VIAFSKLPEVHATTGKPPLVIFAPAWPSKSGIATYVHELLPYHMHDFDVTLVVADEAALPEEFDAGPQILLASEFRRHRSFFVNAPKLYHMGNNAGHCYMLDFVKSDPGIIVLHDFNLNYLHQNATVGWGEVQAYRSAMIRDYGVFGDHNITWQSARPDREVFATYETPLNGAILESAEGIIAHSRYVQFKAAARAPHVPVWHVPHHLSPQIEEYTRLSKSAARKRLGLPQQPLIITALGFVTRAKKLSFSLGALAQLRSRIPPFRFVIAGERRPSEYDIAPQIESSGLKDLTICTDYLEENEFFLHLAAADVVVNLRYPSGGESSGTLIRSLGMGVPCIVFDDGPMGELPDAVIRKVPWGESARQEFTSALHDLITSATKRQALGANAATYARKHFAIERIAGKYADIVRSEKKRPVPPQNVGDGCYFPSAGLTVRRLRLLGSDAADKLREAQARLWISSPAVPMGARGRSALVIAEKPEPLRDLLSSVFNWSQETTFAMRPESFLADGVCGPDGCCPLRAGEFDLVLVAVAAEMPENKCALFMRRLNAALRFGGSATVEVWHELNTNATSAPLSETQLADRLRDAGFASIRHHSTSEGLFNQLLAPGAKEDVNVRFACVTGQKASEMAVWRYNDHLTGFPAFADGRSR